MAWEQDWDEEGWFRRFQRDFGHNCTLFINRPTPIRWRTYYLMHMTFNEKAGQRFSVRARKVAQETSGEFQTTLQQVILAGDMEAVDDKRDTTC